MGSPRGAGPAPPRAGRSGRAIAFSTSSDARDAEVLEPRRDVGGDARLPAEQLAVVGREDEFPIDGCPDRRARVLDCQTVIMRRVVREGHVAELAPVRHAERLFQRQPHGQAGRLPAGEREKVIVAIGVVAEDDARPCQSSDSGFTWTSTV